MFGSKVASCPWCSAVCPRATTTMRRTAPLPSSPSPPHLSHLAQVSFLRLRLLLHSLIHSFLHSFIHSFGELKKELVFRNPPPFVDPRGNNHRPPRRSASPSPSDCPARGRNKKPGLPTDGDRPILQLEPSSSPRIGTRSSSSSWLTLARSMPTQQVIINKRLTN